MQQIPKGDLPPVCPVSEADVVDRRWLGRRDAHPALIPMLRAPADVRGLAEEAQRFLDQDGDDRLALMRGVAFACVLAVPIWTAVGLLGYLMFNGH